MKEVRRRNNKMYLDGGKQGKKGVRRTEEVASKWLEDVKGKKLASLARDPSATVFNCIGWLCG